MILCHLEIAPWAMMRSGRVRTGEPTKRDGLERTRVRKKKSDQWVNADPRVIGDPIRTEEPNAVTNRKTDAIAAQLRGFSDKVLSIIFEGFRSGPTHDDFPDDTRRALTNPLG
jgi:hypothetical protein